MKRYIVCDIDGILNNIKDEAKFYHMKWIDHFNYKCVNLPPNRLMFDFLKTMIESNYNIVFLTGRPENFRDKTNGFLMLNLGMDAALKCNLVMRERKETRSSVQQKEDWITSNIGWHSILMAFDDREDIRRMYEKHGVICFSNSPDYMSDIYKPATHNQGA